MRNRVEEIKSKGFNIVQGRQDINYQQPTGYVGLPMTNFEKIKVGAKILDDATFRLGDLREINPRLANKKTVLEAINNYDLETMREISEFFYKTSGIYSRLVRYMAFMYRYDWYITPITYANKDKVKAEKLTGEFYSCLELLDGFDVKKTFGDIDKLVADSSLVVNSIDQYPTEEQFIYLRQKMQERPMCVQHPLSDLRAVVDDMRMAGDTMWEVRRGELLVGMAICRVEENGILLRECLYEDKSAHDTLIATIAAHYERSEIDVIDTTGREGDYFGMARIINTEDMLKAYAQLHPEMECTLSITDDLLSENNGCYYINKGICECVNEPCNEAEQLTIAQLTQRVLSEENPLMSLMMND